MIGRERRGEREGRKCSVSQDPHREMAPLPLLIMHSHYARQLTI